MYVYVYVNVNVYVNGDGDGDGDGIGARDIPLLTADGREYTPIDSEWPHQSAGLAFMDRWIFILYIPLISPGRVDNRLKMYPALT